MSEETPTTIPPIAPIGIPIVETPTAVTALRTAFELIAEHVEDEMIRDQIFDLIRQEVEPPNQRRPTRARLTKAQQQLLDEYYLSDECQELIHRVHTQGDRIAMLQGGFRAKYGLDVSPSAARSRLMTEIDHVKIPGSDNYITVRKKKA
jgi:hypothetical protein